MGVLAAVILCALFQVGDGTDKARTADILGAAAIAAMLLRPADALIQEAVATVRAISDYGKLLLPVMGSALASSGGASASAGLYFGTALFDSVLTSIVSGLLAPAIYLFLALAVGAAAIGDPLLGRFRDFFKGFITWGLKIVLYLFTGYMAITRVVSGTVDAAAIKAAKLTLSRHGARWWADCFPTPPRRFWSARRWCAAPPRGGDAGGAGHDCRAVSPAGGAVSDAEAHGGAVRHCRAIRPIPP